jgi:hypothetical protein
LQDAVQVRGPLAQRVGDAENHLASFISAPEFFAFQASSPFIRFSPETLTPPYFAWQLK